MNMLENQKILEMPTQLVGHGFKIGWLECGQVLKAIGIEDIECMILSKYISYLDFHYSIINSGMLQLVLRS